MGRGEVAEVWLARDAETDCDVALKVGLTPGDGVLLAREALHASLALSPRLPELVDLGWLELERDRATVASLAPGPAETVPTGERPPVDRRLRPFVAVRWIHGTSLDAECGPPAGSTDGLLKVARDVAEALADLHGAGIAHGDVKPQNLIRTEDGRVALIDLGLACSAYQSELRGATPRYLARRDGALGDARTRDLLALGVVLAELSSPEVARARDAVGAARDAALAAPMATLETTSACTANRCVETVPYRGKQGIDINISEITGTISIRQV